MLQLTFNPVLTGVNRLSSNSAHNITVPGEGYVGTYGPKEYVFEQF